MSLGAKGIIPGLGLVRVKAIDEASEREVRNLQLERWSIRVVRIIVTFSVSLYCFIDGEVLI